MCGSNPAARTCDLARDAAGNVMLMQEKTAREIRATELAVLRSSAVANPPSEDGAYSACADCNQLITDCALHSVIVACRRLIA
jgi:hypothetical protein